MMLDRLKQDLKTAMLAKDETAVSTLRMLLAAITNAAIDAQEPLKDSDIVSVVQKEIKKRQEASSAFHQGGREQSAQKEEAEAQVLKKYLPAQMSEEELLAIIDGVIKETKASGLADMGRVIGSVMGRVGQAAEGSRVSQLVRQNLAGDQ